MIACWNSAALRAARDANTKMNLSQKAFPPSKEIDV
jgi:hypothetical protein